MVNVWTRDDLPTVFDDSRGTGRPWNPSPYMMSDLAAWLNEHHPKPELGRWRRAHAIVEAERDQARESLRRLRDETDFDLFTVRDQLKQCRGEREQMTRDRDEWRARAEAAEARTAPAVSYPLHQPDGTHMDASHLPIFADDDPAEARTTRTVTRDEVEKAIRDAFEYGGTVGEVRQMAAEVCALLGVEAEPDPVETKAEELFKIANPTLEWAWASGPNEEAYRRMAAHVLGQEAGQ